MTNKFGAKKTMIDGYTFDSKKEATRYCELKLLQRAGKISGLTLQKEYLLIPAQYDGKKCVERAVKYIADFSYTENGETVVEDVKGFKEGGAYSVFTIKRKLMLFVHNIKIKEI